MREGCSPQTIGQRTLSLVDGPVTTDDPALQYG
jgi:hypothetical protein